MIAIAVFLGLAVALWQLGKQRKRAAKAHKIHPLVNVIYLFFGCMIWVLIILALGETLGLPVVEWLAVMEEATR